MKRTIAAIVVTLSLGAVCFAVQEKHRGPELAQSPLVVPMRGVDSQAIDWEQAAAMLAVLAGISTGAQYIFNRLVLEPAQRRQAESIFLAMKQWAQNEFPTNLVFQKHTAADEAHQRETERALKGVNEIQDEHCDRLTKIHDDVLILKTKANAQ
jgi:hypothetical protein